MTYGIFGRILGLAEPAHWSALRPALLLTLALLAAACADGSAGATDAAGADPARPYLRVLGTVQDGGLPHVACTCDHCLAARADPERRRRVASLALVLPAAGEVYLVDATPDLPEQLDALADVRRPPAGRVDRAPVDGVFLTHAHIGHYLGLAFFGFEAVHTRELPVFCTPRMADFLRRNGPWEQLVRLGNIDLREVAPGRRLELGDGVTVTPLQVPHRDEYSDTVAFLFEGRRRVLYVPDTDGWESWPESALETLTGVDVALVDGSFYSLDELPGRSVESIGHPLITRSMDRFQRAVDEAGLEVHFTHMNHSNPVLSPRSPARREVEARGFHVLGDGEEIPL